MCVSVRASAECVPLAFCQRLLLTYQYLFLTQCENNAQKIEHLMIEDRQNERAVKIKIRFHHACFFFFTGCREKFKNNAPG